MRVPRDSLHSPLLLCALVALATLFLMPGVASGQEWECEKCHGKLANWPQHLTLTNCTGCHTVHEIELEHGTLASCRLCHDPVKPDNLVVAGNTFSLAQVSEVCAQCHPDRYSQWEEGIHGKKWLGIKSCIEEGCHGSPHSPRVVGLPTFPYVGIISAREPPKVFDPVTAAVMVVSAFIVVIAVKAG